MWDPDFRAGNTNYNCWKFNKDNIEKSTNELGFTTVKCQKWQKVIGQSVSGGLFPFNHGFEYNNGSNQYISKDVMEKYK
jgi:hypothetical protein